jgi:hypothetical protein
MQQILNISHCLEKMNVQNELPRRKQRAIAEGSDHSNVASDGVLDPMLRNKLEQVKIISITLVGLKYTPALN